MLSFFLSPLFRGLVLPWFVRTITNILMFGLTGLLFIIYYYFRVSLTYKQLAWKIDIGSKMQMVPFIEILCFFHLLFVVCNSIFVCLQWCIQLKP